MGMIPKCHGASSGSLILAWAWLLQAPRHVPDALSPTHLTCAHPLSHLRVLAAQGWGWGWGGDSSSGPALSWALGPWPVGDGGCWGTGVQRPLGSRRSYTWRN